MLETLGTANITSLLKAETRKRKEALLKSSFLYGKGGSKQEPAGVPAHCYSFIYMLSEQ